MTFGCPALSPKILFIFSFFSVMHIMSQSGMMGKQNNFNIKLKTSLMATKDKKRLEMYNPLI